MSTPSNIQRSSGYQFMPQEDRNDLASAISIGLSPAGIEASAFNPFLDKLGVLQNPSDLGRVPTPAVRQALELLPPVLRQGVLQWSLILRGLHLHRIQLPTGEDDQPLVPTDPVQRTLWAENLARRWTTTSSEGTVAANFLPPDIQGPPETPQSAGSPGNLTSGNPSGFLTPSKLPKNPFGVKLTPDNYFIWADALRTFQLQYVPAHAGYHDERLGPLPPDLDSQLLGTLITLTEDLPVHAQVKKLTKGTEALTILRETYGGESDMLRQRLIWAEKWITFCLNEVQPMEIQLSQFNTIRTQLEIFGAKPSAFDTADKIIKSIPNPYESLRTQLSTETLVTNPDLPALFNKITRGVRAIDAGRALSDTKRPTPVMQVGANNPKRPRPEPKSTVPFPFHLNYTKLTSAQKRKFIEERRTYIAYREANPNLTSSNDSRAANFEAKYRGQLAKTMNSQDPYEAYLTKEAPAF